jgi:tetratricopeptide (TPR) repeat protein
MTDTAAKPKYRAFVSYSHADKTWARWVQRELESYRIPKAIVRETGLATNTLRPVFRDSDELGSTPDLSEAVQDALTESEALIVVCSAAARESAWVNREVEFFLALSPERAKRVYCLLVDGDANDDIAQVLPDALSDYKGLAADVRKGGDGPKRARLKLVSALVGVNLDRLVQRDRMKRRHRAVVLGTAATALALLVAVLVHQSRLSSLEAKEKARAADELVTYMLEDLDKRLDEFDGVAKLDPGFDAALAYFEGLVPEDMSNETLERYFDALTIAGDFRMRQGNNDDALRIWERSSEISGRLVERDPNNANSWRRHGDSFVSLALAHWEDPDEIVVNMKKALQFFEKAAEMDPEEFDNHGIRVTTLNNLGAGYTNLRDFDTARNTFVRSLALNEDLRSMQWPESANATDRLLSQEAESAAWMTELELHLGRPEAAVEWHEREITIRREKLRDRGNPVRLGDALKWGAVAYESVAAGSRQFLLATTAYRVDPKPRDGGHSPGQRGRRKTGIGGGRTASRRPGNPASRQHRRYAFARKYGDRLRAALGGFLHCAITGLRQPSEIPPGAACATRRHHFRNRDVACRSHRIRRLRHDHRGDGYTGQGDGTERFRVDRANVRRIRFPAGQAGRSDSPLVGR